jgi:hypothetical protein
VLLTSDDDRPAALRDSAADGDSELAQNPGARSKPVDRVRAEVESEAVPEVGDGAATEVAILLEDGDSASTARQINRCRESGDASANDCHVTRHSRHRIAPCSGWKSLCI